MSRELVNAKIDEDKSKSNSLMRAATYSQFWSARGAASTNSKSVKFSDGKLAMEIDGNDVTIAYSGTLQGRVERRCPRQTFRRSIQRQLERQKVAVNSRPTPCPFPFALAQAT
jgi:hypothetical protein